MSLSLSAIIIVIFMYVYVIKCNSTSNFVNYRTRNWYVSIYNTNNFTPYPVSNSFDRLYFFKKVEDWGIIFKDCFHSQINCMFVYAFTVVCYFIGIDQFILNIIYIPFLIEMKSIRFESNFSCLYGNWRWGVLDWDKLAYKIMVS